MSRSFKKCVGYFDRSPFMKAKANEKVRHYKDLPDGMFYKKVFEQYNIHDHMCHYWGAADLQLNFPHYDREKHIMVAPKKLPCFNELKKSDTYRKAKRK